MNTDFTPEELEHYNAVNQAKRNMARDALALEVAKLVAQGYEVKKKTSGSVRLAVKIMDRRWLNRPKAVALALWMVLGLPVVLLSGIVVPVLGWIVTGIGWGFVFTLIMSIGTPKPKTVSIEPDGQVRIA